MCTVEPAGVPAVTRTDPFCEVPDAVVQTAGAWDVVDPSPVPSSATGASPRSVARAGCHATACTAACRWVLE